MRQGQDGAWRRAMRRWVLIGGVALVAASCTGAQDDRAEREGQRVREDVRGLRDFFHDRGVTVDTRLPER